MANRLPGDLSVNRITIKRDDNIVKTKEQVEIEKRLKYLEQTLIRLQEQLNEQIPTRETNSKTSNDLYWTQPPSKTETGEDAS